MLSLDSKELIDAAAVQTNDVITRGHVQRARLKGKIKPVRKVGPAYLYDEAAVGGLVAYVRDLRQAANNAKAGS